MAGPLSVVIPSHNRADLLRVCLDAVLRHAPADTEVIVVDDASPAAAVSRTAAAFAGVRVLRRPVRGGFCAAANAGLAAAVHPIVELLNDDVEVEAGWAEAALRWFDDPTVAAVAPLVLRRADGGCATAVSAVQCGHDTAETAVAHRDPLIDSAGDGYYLGGVARKRGSGRPVTPEYRSPGFVFGASGSSAFYRRDAVRAVGGFPESFGAYFEDVDLAFRLHRAGGRIAYEPASRAWHRVSASYGAPSGELLALQARNEERVFWRNLPAGALARALPLHLAVLAGKAWRRWREGRLFPFLRGKLAVLGEAAELVRHRRRLGALGPGSDWAGWRLDGCFWGCKRP